MKNVSNVHCDRTQELGATMVEYAMLVAMLAALCVIAVRTLSTTMSNQFENLTDTLDGP